MLHNLLCQSRFLLAVPRTTNKVTGVITQKLISTQSAWVNIRLVAVFLFHIIRLKRVVIGNFLIFRRFCNRAFDLVSPQ